MGETFEFGGLFFRGTRRTGFVSPVYTDDDDKSRVINEGSPESVQKQVFWAENLTFNSARNFALTQNFFYS